MKTKNPFSDLTVFERSLWIVSVTAIIISSAITGFCDPLSLITSLVGVTALIFIARGYVIGQVLLIIFSVLYGIISFGERYYGEMITYVGMSAPIALVTAIEWAKHPYKGTREVEVAHITKRRFFGMCALSVAVTVIFYFILRALGNGALLFSTLSVTTSFIASYLTFLRSPYYALGYAANDLVLVVLWVIAAAGDISSLPMAVCFVMFALNDIYGFVSWKKMQKRQMQS